MNKELRLIKFRGYIDYQNRGNNVRLLCFNVNTMRCSNNEK